jgi:hypothetical protein
MRWRMIGMRTSPVIPTLVLLGALVCAAPAATTHHFRRHAWQVRRTSARPQAAESAAWVATLGTENDEQRRYEEAKAKAQADPALQDLKARSDSALADDEGRQAAIAYNRALFQKIREIDGTLTDRADSIETAILRRIGE